MFREFAFTLAGAVFISGVVALTLSPVMSAILLKARTEDRGWSGSSIAPLTGCGICYARVLDATLSARPAVYIIWIVLGLLVFPLYMMSSKELAPAEDQGFAFGAVFGQADATIEQLTYYQDEVNKVL